MHVLRLLFVASSGSPPNGLQQPSATDHPIGVLRENDEQIAFRSCQANSNITHLHGSAHDAQRDFPHRGRRRGGPGRSDASEKGTHPRDRLHHTHGGPDHIVDAGREIGAGAVVNCPGSGGDS
jgi:hypothetical protein